MTTLMKSLALLATALLSVQALSAQTPPAPDPAVAPAAAPAEGAAPAPADLEPGKILAQAYVVRGADFFDKLKSQPDMKVESVTDAKRTDPLFLAVMFYNPAKDQSGIARVTYSFTMTYPNGQTQASPAALKAGEGPLPDNVQKTWMATSQRVRLPLNPQSPAGLYKFAVVVKDQISGFEYKSNIEINID